MGAVLQENWILSTCDGGPHDGMVVSHDQSVGSVRLIEPRTGRKAVYTWSYESALHPGARQVVVHQSGQAEIAELVNANRLRYEGME